MSDSWAGAGAHDCVSNEISGDAFAAGLGTIHENHCTRHLRALENKLKTADLETEHHEDLTQKIFTGTLTFIYIYVYIFVKYKYFLISLLVFVVFLKPISRISTIKEPDGTSPYCPQQILLPTVLWIEISSCLRDQDSPNNGSPKFR